ncbi:hypothetical protein ABK040_002080 [Willaertia magna]
MKQALIQTTLMLLIGMFVYYAQAAVQYTTNGGKTTVVSNGITLVITGNSNVPKFSYGIKQNANTLNETNDEYNVMFQKAYQVDASGKKLGQSSYSLPAYGWSFKDFKQGASNSSLDFTLESTTVQKDGPSFKFNVHLSDNISNFKFDVTISNVTWNSAAAKLYLCFKLQQKGGDASVGSSNSSQVTFGSNGYFSVEPYAVVPEDNNRQVNVTLVNDSEGESSMTCISYDKWGSQRLFHDPTLGVKVASTSGASQLVMTFSSILFVIVSLLFILF